MVVKEKESVKKFFLQMKNSINTRKTRAKVDSLRVRTRFKPSKMLLFKIASLRIYKNKALLGNKLVSVDTSTIFRERSTNSFAIGFYGTQVYTNVDLSFESSLDLDS